MADETKPEPERVPKQIKVNPDLWWEFRGLAHAQKTTLEDLLNDLLCREVNRHDLLSTQTAELSSAS